MPVSSQGKEEYETFLQNLRDQRMFDLALVYLDDLEASNLLDKDFASTLKLERGVLLYQSAAMQSKKSPRRSANLDAAERALQGFLSENPQHPRRGEARLKLGELLLTRAEEAKADAGADQAAPEAVKFYDDAHKLFESTISELAKIYEGIKGNRTDPNDLKAVAYRRKLQQDLRQAQLLSAKAIDERGRSRAPNSAERKKDLEQALGMFQALYTKETKNLGVRNYALFYRSLAQASLDKTADAIDGLQRVADLEGVDALRPLQTQAVTELIKLLAAESKFQPAHDFGKKWLQGLTPAEEKWPEAIDLKLALARADLAWSKELEAADPGDRVASKLKKDTRTELRSVFRVPGPHLEETKELLASLGAAPREKDTTELPKVRDFPEAFAAAQERIDEVSRLGIELESVREQASSEAGNDATRQEAQKQLAATQQLIELNQDQAITLLRQGLSLFADDDDRQQLFDARFRLAYLLLKENKAWDALVIGRFLAESNPGTDSGLRASAVTLSAFSDLLRAESENQSLIIDELAPFAEYLVKTWPQSDEASSAASAIVQLAVVNKEWDRAEEFLQVLPSGSGNVSKLQRDMGISSYVQFLAARKTDGADDERVKSLRDRALKWLGLGLKDFEAKNLDRGTVDSVNALARLQLLTDQADKAKKLLLGGKGLLAALEKTPDVVPAEVSMESYRTAIQVIADQLVNDKIAADAAVQQMQQYVAKLQDLASKSDGGEKKLAGIFLGLAKDLKEKLANTKAIAKRSKLSEAILLVVSEAGSSESFNTQYWAADTIVSIAEEMASEKSLRAKAAPAFAKAAEALAQILAKEQQTPGWIQPEGFETKIRLLKARAQIGNGDYQDAVLGLGEILDEQNNLLDVQIEAAKALQAWGTIKPEMHKYAFSGGRSKKGQNVIWGWGKIGQITSRQMPNFEEQFFEARYELARSRYLYGKALSGEKSKEVIAKAEQDIQRTYLPYPELGGTKQKKKFDALLKIIQGVLGKPNLGLSALQQ